MPQGVEHYKQTAASSIIYATVNEPLMPQGVEHLKLIPKYFPIGLMVNEPLMPQGVEHQAKTDAETLAYR